ncbi:dihydrolipoamide acetyltransferase family protein [Malacoplasma iowae]|uniref:Dihydrolipoamide acetyltransferase component of pyruvate dehydrogenase complex n=1 Tax=Malacoplasma iowae DK-CPA TaxID=1394179 RepID=A0A084U4I2_MALIO|nr:dihydrolipoamide acetyltransferase family protein [Malacoplasma iowae]KFB07868.1 branched-chain alpha-ketoacid dehydrogenase subunit E2 [Malacoplasma iowae DK-CPA]
MYSFKFADIGEGIHEGKVGEILVKEGDTVKDGTNIIVVETDKVTTEIASPVNGTISKILIKVGDTIHVGQELFLIDTGSGSATSPSPAEVPVEKKEEPKEEVGASVVGEVKVSNNVLPSFESQQVEMFSSKEESSTYHNADVLASPVARLLALEHNVDLSTIKGTGPSGRILKDDILSLISNKDSSSSQPVQTTVTQQVVTAPVANSQVVTANVSQTSIATREDKAIETTPMRKAIAKAMKESWSNVAYTNLAVEIDVTELWDQRNKFKDLILEQEGIKLTLLPFIVKAISKALVKYPTFNSHVDEANGQIIQKGAVNIGIAIDTKDGLIVPNIKNADRLSVLDIAKEITLLAEKARTKKIQMSDLAGGTFSISNYGSLGASFGVPVIKHPEIAIAGIGTLENKAKRVGLHFVERKVMYLTVAADHRWVDGGDIARFVGLVKQYLENFTLLFI